MWKMALGRRGRSRDAATRCGAKGSRDAATRRGAVGGNRVLAAPSSLCEGQDRPPDALTALPAQRPAGKALARPPAEGPSACQGGGEVLPASAQGDFPGK